MTIQDLKNKAHEAHLNRLLSIKEYLINNINEKHLKDKLESRMDLDKTCLWLTIDIDEFYFYINDCSFQEFCQQHFNGYFNGDKQFIIKDFYRI